MPAGLATEPGEGKPGEIQAKDGGKAVVEIHEPRGHEHRAKRERVAERIIVQRGKLIVAFAKGEAPCREGEALSCEQASRSRAQRAGIIDQGLIVLLPAVRDPDQGLALDQKPDKADGCDQGKAETIGSEKAPACFSLGAGRKQRSRIIHQRHLQVGFRGSCADGAERPGVFARSVWI